MFTFPKTYDVLVIGAGHAGVEAALAAARLGAETAMLTQNLDSIGQMSCNPAVGGLAKGHMIREIDALGGVMGINADATAIQCRMLNASKGPSVRGPRSQCDKKAYQFRLKAVCESQERLDLHQGGAARLVVNATGDRVEGVETHLGVRYLARTVVVTTGTFLRGLLHVGMQNQTGGRMGDPASSFSDSLRALGFELGRFKTGTPCRLNGRSIDFSVCEPHPGDEPPPAFTFWPERLERRGSSDLFTLNEWRDGKFHVEQILCWTTQTNERTHAVIRDNLDKSPMYAGKIEGVGPRYCPSIEDKVVKFAEKTSHQLFLEPEGRHTREYYVNGISTSLPYEVQLQFVRSIRGLERAEIIRPGYAVEYDYCPPTQLRPTLENQGGGKTCFFAGQINGTSGYEEAAAQGIVAGINAGRRALGGGPFVLGRADAYIGVLVDDLVTKGTNEPYRMFTSRAEHRLLLRADKRRRAPDRPGARTRTHRRRDVGRAPHEARPPGSRPRLDRHRAPRRPAAGRVAAPSGERLARAARRRAAGFPGGDLGAGRDGPALRRLHPAAGGQRGAGTRVGKQAHPGRDRLSFHRRACARKRGRSWRGSSRRTSAKPAASAA